MAKDPREYLYSKLSVDEITGCWNWTGSLFDGGYGVFKCRNLNNNVPMNASRASWIIHHGFPEGRLWVLHRCDNPACCNPGHLFLGSYKDNVIDMVEKGRNSHGSGRPASKLKESDIPEIRTLLTSGETQKDVAKLYGVSWHTIQKIWLGAAWKHVS